MRFAPEIFELTLRKVPGDLNPARNVHPIPMLERLVTARPRSENRFFFHHSRSIRPAEERLAIFRDSEVNRGAGRLLPVAYAQRERPGYAPFQRLVVQQN